MKVDGACHCGEIAWKAEIDPARVMVCHCDDCRVMSGGAFQWGVPVAAERFTLLRGEPKAYRRQGSSGAWRRMVFCGTCSTLLYGTEDERPATYSLRLAACRQAREFTPMLQVWRRSALDWVDLLGELPAHESQPANLHQEN